MSQCKISTKSNTISKQLIFDIVSFLLKAGLPLKSAVKEDIHKNESHLETSRPDIMTNPSQSNQQALNEAKKQQITQPIRTEKKIGRNEPCPCGSGKKYKKCHGN